MLRFCFAFGCFLFQIDSLIAGMDLSLGLLEKFTAKLSDQDYDLLQGHKGRNEAGLELRTGMDVATWT